MAMLAGEGGQSRRREGQNHPGSNPRRTRQRSVPEAARIAGRRCGRQLAGRWRRL